MIIYRVTWKLDGHNSQTVLVSEAKKAEKLRADLMLACSSLCAHFEYDPIIVKVEVQ